MHKSFCGPYDFCFSKVAGMSFARGFLFLEGKSEGRCMSHILISADTQTFSQSEL